MTQEFRLEFDTGGTPEPAAPAAPWGYREILLLAGVTLMAQLLAARLAISVIMRVRQVGEQAAMDLIQSSAHVAVPLQIVAWAPILAYIAYVVRGRYGMALSTGLAWEALPRPVRSYVRVGLLLAMGSVLASIAIADPERQTPMTDLLADREALWLVACFGTLIAPCLEEVVFRGFLFGALERIHGRWAALFVTSAVFAVLHGSQYGWQWPLLALLHAIGLVLGTVRMRSGSTKASTLVHSCYNGMLFLLLVVGQDWLG